MYCCNCSAVLKYDNTLTTAAVMLPNINPMMRMAIVSLTLLETANTANNTKKLPRLAAITMLHFDIKYVAKTPPNNPEPKIIIATPKLAPELIPSTNGPAKGFLNKVCINKPEMPNPDPTSIAVIAFGSRKSLIIICQVSFSNVPNNPSITLPKGMLMEPRQIFTKKHNNNTINSIKK